MSGRKLSGAKVAAGMKKLQCFSDRQLAESLGIDENGARRWRQSYADEGLLTIDGTGPKPPVGRSPNLWRWQG